MKRALAILGVLMIAMGSLWVCQGLGWVHWPPESFMLDQRPWAWRGGVVVVVGVGLLLLTRRRGPSA